MSSIRNVCLSFVLILGWQIAVAESANDSVQFMELCRYDDWCKRLKNRDGTYVQPKKNLMAVLRTLNQPLREISKSLDIDPTAVAGAILAENSLNVQVDDDTHAFLEKIQLNPVANDISKLLRGKSFSIGFGQIKPESAQEAEDVLAKTEGRPKRTPEEIKQALLNPIESIKYAAAIIRQCQDEYFKNGFDVSKDPAVLVTLYNLGSCREKAKAAAGKKRAPRPNFFGFFVSHFKDDIIREVGLGDQGVVVGAPSRALKQASINNRLTNAVRLYGSPPRCSTSGPGQVGEYFKVATLSQSPRSVLAEGEYQVLAVGLDCDMRDWSLIQTSRGEIGWISNEVLQKNSEEFAKGNEGSSCSSSKNSDCLERLKKDLNDSVLGVDSNGLLEISLEGGVKNPGKPNVKKFDVYACLGSGSGGAGAIAHGKLTLIDPQKAEELRQRTEAKKKEIIGKFGYRDWDDKRNFFKEILNSLDFGWQNSCKNRCRVDVETIEKLMSEDPLKYKGYKGYKEFVGNYARVSIEAVVTIDKDKPKPELSQWKERLEQIERECGQILAFSPKSKGILENLRNWVDEAAASEKGLPALDTVNYGSEANILGVCRGLNRVRTSRAQSGGQSTEVKLAEEDCSGCRVNMTFKTGANSSLGTSVDLELLANIVNEDDDYDDILFGALESFGHRLGRYQQDEPPECTYDPVASTKKVELIAASPCVDAVFVPDHYIANKMSDSPKGVFYKPFSEDDRFAIKLKDGCSKMNLNDGALNSSPVGNVQ